MRTQLHTERTAYEKKNMEILGVLKLVLLLPHLFMFIVTPSFPWCSYHFSGDLLNTGASVLSLRITFFFSRMALG